MDQARCEVGQRIRSDVLGSAYVAKPGPSPTKF